MIGVSDLGRVGFAMHYWLHLSNSSMLDCIRFERSFSPFETKSETLVIYSCSAAHCLVLDATDRHGFFRMRRVGYNVECGVLNVEWVLWMLND